MIKKPLGSAERNDRRQESHHHAADPRLTAAGQARRLPQIDSREPLSRDARDLRCAGGRSLHDDLRARRRRLRLCADYLGIGRSDDLVIIQITVSNTRPVAQKQRLYRRIAELLAESPGLRREDIFINLVEVLPENWSFGNGEAQYVR